MRKKGRQQGFESAISTAFRCAWCEDVIPDDVELFTVGAIANSDIDLTEAKGRTIPLLLEKASKTVEAIVPTSESPAAKEGIDLLFTVCSLGCAQALTNALRDELNLVDKANLLQLKGEESDVR